MSLREDPASSKMPPGERVMSSRAIAFRLLMGVVALGCGAAALIVAILLIRGVVA
jgi:hypothetical protein